MTAPSPALAAPGVRTGPLHIEMVLPSLVSGGMEMMVVRLVRALARHGHRLGITCTEDSGPLASRLTREGHRIDVVPVLGMTPNFFPQRLARHLRALRPDVVHVHSGAWLKAARAARCAGVPCVIHSVHGLLDREPWHEGILKRWAARSTDHIGAVSEPLRDYLVGRVGLAASKVSVVHNGIDTEEFRPGPRTGALRRALGIDLTSPVIGTVARLATVKNQALMVEAFGRIAASTPAAHLVLVGDGPERPALERLIAARGLGGRVHLAGEMEVGAETYREFDVFALTSVAEGTSLSILEALATELCVVATAVGGNPALLDGGRAGLLVPSGDVDACAAAFATALGGGARARALGRAGREHVIAQYSERAMVAHYEAMYRGACAESTAPGREGDAPCAE